MAGDTIAQGLNPLRVKIMNEVDSILRGTDEDLKLAMLDMFRNIKGYAEEATVDDRGSESN